jgi:hypothetical protein
MMRNIIFFIVTMTSLFSSAQPFIPPRIVKQNKFPITKETQLSERPFQDISKDKICNECKYFIKDGRKCKLFYNVDLVDGRQYDKASEVRKSNNRCGPEGKYYEKNKFVFVKKMGDILYENYPIIITCSYVILYIFILNYKYK